INISHIVSHAKKDINLFSFSDKKNSKRVKSKELIKLLQSHGYNSVTSKNRYVKFHKKSPIDLLVIKNEIEKLYRSKYINIEIKNISVRPRAYIKSLPEHYQVNMRSRNHLSNSGTLYIKTPQRKKIFFDYHIDAVVTIFIARKNIKKDVELSSVNTRKETISLDKFRAMPLQDIQRGTVQTKHHIKKDSVITLRDMEALSIVKRDSRVSVSLTSNSISISFVAKALQDGKLNDIITIQKSNKKRLKARVVGKNRVEIR
ncbi:MAG: flagellar basal body P-ring formation protein FlgA, partial [Sulfurimonas sp.]|nr:flagellar basal body P-ring formation protein FlgA [Sulfurimonas sp.]